MKLPWLKDKILSSYSEALGVLNWVVKWLEHTNYYRDYLEGFCEQEVEGVIEK